VNVPFYLELEPTLTDATASENTQVQSISLLLIAPHPLHVAKKFSYD